jgi:hypothetical protein
VSRRRTPALPALAGGLVVTLAVAGCSAGKPSADKCATVDAEMVDIATRTDQEPKMRIPVPAGWERRTNLDSENIRFAIRNSALEAQGFTPNAVVTLQRFPADLGKPQQIIEVQNQDLAKKLKADDLSTSPATVCGVPAVASGYTAPEVTLPNPEIPPIPPRKASALSVAYRDGDSIYLAIVTVQTAAPDDPTYVRDSATILDGFQILPVG